MAAGVADSSAGRHFEIACVDALLIKIHGSARIDLECPVDVGVSIHCFQRQAKRKTEQHRIAPGWRDRRQARVRNLFGQPDVDVQPKRRRDLVLEKPSEAAMVWIDTPQQFAFIETEAQRVICLPRSGFPRGFLPCEDGRQAIEVRDNTAIDRLVDRE